MGLDLCTKMVSESVRTPRMPHECVHGKHTLPASFPATAAKGEGGGCTPVCDCRRLLDLVRSRAARRARQVSSETARICVKEAVKGIDLVGLLIDAVRL